jgi:hypothetical protein
MKGGGPSQRGRRLEAEGAESEGENQSWPSWKGGRCGGGGVGGVEGRGWQALGRDHKVSVSAKKVF